MRMSLEHENNDQTYPADSMTICNCETDPNGFFFVSPVCRYDILERYGTRKRFVSS